MQVFVAGTDTEVGKTLICSWLCLQTGYEYFKPIQTGAIEGTDSERVAHLSETTVHREAYVYQAPLSPHAASLLENQSIDVGRIRLPAASHLIVEGSGGLLTPVNRTHFMIDVIKQLGVPVILVARSRLGTINHTLLSLEALAARAIPCLGVILSGPLSSVHREAIAFYGRTSVLAEVPWMEAVHSDALRQVMMPTDLKNLLRR